MQKKGYKIDLGILDNISGSITEANKEVVKALELKGEAAKLAQISLKKNQDLIKELTKAESLLKQIGLDSELAKVQKAIQEINGNIKGIDSIITRLLSV
jgi:phage-related protein